MSTDQAPRAHPVRYRETFPVLFNGSRVARGLDAAIEGIDPVLLAAAYERLRRLAPRRPARGLRYFVGHTGIPGSGSFSNRREEHLALALWNLRKTWPLPDGGSMRLLDYQVPLKARRSDAGIGKLDLLGLGDDGRLVVVELKVVGKEGGRGDTPLAALMEALRYAAIVEANHAPLAAEIREHFCLTVAPEPPRVLLLGTRCWWRAWQDLAAAGARETPFTTLLETVRTRLGVEVTLAQLAPVELTYGLDGARPSLCHAPRLERVDPAASWGA